MSTPPQFNVNANANSIQCRRARRRSRWSRRPAGSARSYGRSLSLAPLSAAWPPRARARSRSPYVAGSLLTCGCLGQPQKKSPCRRFLFVSPPRVSRAPPSQGGARDYCYCLSFSFFYDTLTAKTMKGYLSRRYAAVIVAPRIQRSIGNGLLNTGGFLATQQNVELVTEAGEYLQTEQLVLTARTFRIRHGNGYYGTKLGELIQDQYPYYVIDPNADNVGQPNKDDFASAVAAWKSLSSPDKKYWDDEAVRLHLHMSGFNLYIRKWRLGLL